jgi:hypothetical protein
MKHIGKIALLGAVIAATSPAFAASITGSISISGSGTYTSTTVTFVPGSTTVGFGTVSGSSFTPYFTGGQPVTMTSFTFSPLTSPQQVFQVVEAGETLTYFLTSDSGPFINGAGDLTIKGSGYFTETGAVNFSQTAATFSLTSQAGGGGATVTFSNTSTATPTPEPNSLMLLGTGLVGAAGMLFRRRLTA